jgi:hypothetical protein
MEVDMWCCRCNKQVHECVCPDIEERLASLAGGPAEIAAGQNLLRRRAAQINAERGVTSANIASTPLVKQNG